MVVKKASPIIDTELEAIASTCALTSAMDARPGRRQGLSR